MAITKADMAAAREAGARVGPGARGAFYIPEQKALGVEFDNGVRISVPVALIQGLDGATDEQLMKIELTPAGSGLHFPELDADVYVPALLNGVYGSRAWMAALGSRTSAAKAASSRENGKLGGRPKKVKPPVVADITNAAVMTVIKNATFKTIPFVTKEKAVRAAKTHAGVVVEKRQIRPARPATTTAAKKKVKVPLERRAHR